MKLMTEPHNNEVKTDRIERRTRQADNHNWRLDYPISIMVGTSTQKINTEVDVLKTLYN
jgi:hypothetical protein